jgi:hypothetical protein
LKREKEKKGGRPEKGKRGKSEKVKR